MFCAVQKPFSITVIVLISVLMMTACASNSSQQPVAAAVSIAPPPLRAELPTHLDKNNPEGLFSLSEQQRSQFHAYFYDKKNSDVAPHKRLGNYLESQMHRFDYKGSTLKASDAMNQMAGNCLSLTIVTTGLAQSVGLEVQYRRINTPPIYQRDNNILALSTHVQTRVLSPRIDSHSEKNSVIRIGSVVIDYFPSSDNVLGDRVTKEDTIAMYYQNLAAEEMMDNQMSEALEYLYKGLSIAPQNPSLLNALAVVYRRQGFLTDSKNVFAYAAENAPSLLILFENYVTLLESIGQHQQAQEIASQYSFVDDDNPFVWLDLGAEMAAIEDWKKAFSFYRKAVEVGPYLHESHFGLAKTYYALGKEDSALKHMKKAAALARYEDEEPLYSKKLLMMEQLY